MVQISSALVIPAAVLLFQASLANGVVVPSSGKAASKYHSKSVGGASHKQTGTGHGHGSGPNHGHAHSPGSVAGKPHAGHSSGPHPPGSHGSSSSHAHAPGSAAGKPHSGHSANSKGPHAPGSHGSGGKHGKSRLSESKQNYNFIEKESKKLTKEKNDVKKIQNEMKTHEAAFEKAHSHKKAAGGSRAGKAKRDLESEVDGLAVRDAQVDEIMESRDVEEIDVRDTDDIEARDIEEFDLFERDLLNDEGLEAREGEGYEFFERELDGESLEAREDKELQELIMRALLGELDEIDA